MKMVVSYYYTPFKSWGNQLSCFCMQAVRDMWESVVTFDLCELEQPHGSSELGCNKNFTEEPGIVEVYCVIASATMSPSTENPENPMYYFKEVTSSKCLASVPDAISGSKGHITGRSPTMVKTALCPQKCACWRKVSPQPLKRYAFVSCIEDLTKLPLPKRSRFLLLSRWRHHLPFPYHILTAGPIQEFWRRNHHSDLRMHLVILCCLKILKKPIQTLYFFLLLSPWLPPADGTMQQLLALPARRRVAEGLTLNPCLRLPLSLLAFAYWIRINWNFHKGWYKSLSQVSRCGLTRVELC